MVNNREIANGIYKFLQECASEEGQVLPPLRFDINDLENDGLIFRAEQPESYFYFGEVYNFRYTIFYISPNGNDAHFKQLNNLNLIVNKLNDLKKIELKNKVYNIITVLINGEPWPKTN